MDSTLIEQEVIDELAREANRYEEVAQVTQRAMAGELDFAQALRERVSILEGLDEGALDRVQSRLRVTPGTDRLLRALRTWDVTTAVVSGGFLEIVEPFRERLGMDRAEANRLEIRNGELTGRLSGPIVDRARKAAFLRELQDELGIEREQVLAVGDGMNDLDMLKAAGFGVAFDPKPALRQRVQYSVDERRLDLVLEAIGYSKQDIDEASNQALP